jgi:hypothetical protein
MLAMVLVAALAACSDDDDGGADAGAGTPDGAPGGADAMPSEGGDTPDAAAPGEPDPLAAACSPEVSYDNLTANGNGKLFDDHVADVQAYFAEKSLEVCKVLYKNADEVPPRPTLKFVVEDMDGVAYCACSNNTCDEMHLSSKYLRDVANGGGDLGHEIDGVIVHELTHIFQHMGGGAPGWLIEGEADFVRFRAGYIPESNRHPGGNYDDAYQTTAFFLDYVDAMHQDFAWKLNESKDPGNGEEWTEQVFVELTGKSVQALWDDYQDSF